MKKYFIVFLITLVVISGISVSGVSAFAEETLIEYELNGYDVKITYNYSIEFGSGVYFAYEVMFDSDYYKNVVNKEELFDELSYTFDVNGFTVDNDELHGKMVASISYETLTEYYIASGYDGYQISESTAKEKKGFLYNEYTSTSKTVFYNLKTEGKYVNRIYKILADLGVADEKILLEYIYGTPYDNNLITSTADKVVYSTQDRIYQHVFLLDVDELDKEITIFQRSPNSTGWYVIAIIIGLVVIAIPLTIYLIKKRKGAKE